MNTVPSPEKSGEDVRLNCLMIPPIEPSRLMFLAVHLLLMENSVPEDHGRPARSGCGIGGVSDWHNTAEWPVSKRQQTIIAGI